MAATTKFPTGSKEWHSEQINRYSSELPRYKAYAGFLIEVLQKACDTCAPLAIVQARAKTTSSFAEKALRKAFKYDDPVHQLTDLCGARVITHTQDQVTRICEFIAAHFIVDEPNSLNVATRLKSNEFGYLSYHYIVQLKGTSILGVAVPPEIEGRKAEIQVRTLLQHAWADISHDRMYKSGFKVPAYWERESYRLAAVLENADEAFLKFAQGVDAYRVNYGAYMSPEKLRDEIATLQTILENEPDAAKKPATALRIAKLAKANWDWETVLSALDPFAIPSQADAEILLEHGYALCRANNALSNADQSKLYAQGQSELKEAADRGEGKTRVQALTCLGWTHATQPNTEYAARECYQKAFELDPSDPYVLALYLEFEIYCGEKREFVGHMRHTLSLAIETCRAHADAGVELPWAFFTMGRFHWLLGQYYEGLAAYLKAIQLCTSGTACMPEDAFDSERQFLRHINFGKPLSDEDKWLDDLLLLAKSLHFFKDNPLEELKNRALRKEPFIEHVVIVAGGTHPKVEADMKNHQKCLDYAFKSFVGTIVSGGTAVGIPGIIGQVAKNLQAKNNPRVDVIGYIPQLLPADAPRDDRYSEIISTGGTGFTPQEPIQNWIDLVASGVKPSEVRLLGINGGQISAIEYKLALALGAKVGVVQSSGRAVSDLSLDADWGDSEGLLWLPNDPAAFRAFVNPGIPKLSGADLEKAGQAIHEEFLRENRHKSKDPVMNPWSELREDFKEDNRQQAAYSAEILNAAGYEIRELSDKAIKAFEDEAKVDIMAEMEHGRWTVQRLKDGWSYGPKRDTAAKISSYLVSWADLTEEVREWDRQAVRKWPEVMALAGLGIYPKG